MKVTCKTRIKLIFMIISLLLPVFNIHTMSAITATPGTLANFEMRIDGSGSNILGTIVYKAGYIEDSRKEIDNNKAMENALDVPIYIYFSNVTMYVDGGGTAEINDYYWTAKSGSPTVAKVNTEENEIRQSASSDEGYLILTPLALGTAVITVEMSAGIDDNNELLNPVMKTFTVKTVDAVKHGMAEPAFSSSGVSVAINDSFKPLRVDTSAVEGGVTLTIDQFRGYDYSDNNLSSGSYHKNITDYSWHAEVVETPRNDVPHGKIGIGDSISKITEHSTVTESTSVISGTGRKNLVIKPFEEGFVDIKFTFAPTDPNAINVYGASVSCTITVEVKRVIGQLDFTVKSDQKVYLIDPSLQNSNSGQSEYAQNYAEPQTEDEIIVGSSLTFRSQPALAEDFEPDLNSDVDIMFQRPTEPVTQPETKFEPDLNSDVDIMFQNKNNNNNNSNNSSNNLVPTTKNPANNNSNNNNNNNNNFEPDLNSDVDIMYQRPTEPVTQPVTEFEPDLNSDVDIMFQNKNNNNNSSAVQTTTKNTPFEPDLNSDVDIMYQRPTEPVTQPVTEFEPDLNSDIDIMFQNKNNNNNNSQSANNSSNNVFGDAFGLNAQGVNNGTVTPSNNYANTMLFGTEISDVNLTVGNFRSQINGEWYNLGSSYLPYDKFEILEYSYKLPTYIIDKTVSNTTTMTERKYLRSDEYNLRMAKLEEAIRKAEPSLNEDEVIILTAAFAEAFAGANSASKLSDIVKSVLNTASSSTVTVFSSALAASYASLSGIQGLIDPYIRDTVNIPITDIENQRTFPVYVTVKATVHGDEKPYTASHEIVYINPNTDNGNISSIEILTDDNVKISKDQTISGIIDKDNGRGVPINIEITGIDVIDIYKTPDKVTSPNDSAYINTITNLYDYIINVSSSNASIVEVIMTESSNGNTKWVLTPMKAGTAVISVTISGEGRSKTTEFKVSVTKMGVLPEDEGTIDSVILKSQKERIFDDTTLYMKPRENEELTIDIEKVLEFSTSAKESDNYTRSLTEYEWTVESSAPYLVDIKDSVVFGTNSDKSFTLKAHENVTTGDNGAVITVTFANLRNDLPIEAKNEKYTITFRVIVNYLGGEFMPVIDYDRETVKIAVDANDTGNEIHYTYYDYDTNNQQFMYCLKAGDGSASSQAGEKWYPFVGSEMDVSELIPKSGTTPYRLGIRLYTGEDGKKIKTNDEGAYSSANRRVILLPPRKAIKTSDKKEIIYSDQKIISTTGNLTVYYQVGLSGWLKADIGLNYGIDFPSENTPMGCVVQIKHAAVEADSDGNGGSFGSVAFKVKVPKSAKKPSIKDNAKKNSYTGFSDKMEYAVTVPDEGQSWDDVIWTSCPKGTIGYDEMWDEFGEAPEDSSGNVVLYVRTAAVYRNGVLKTPASDIVALKIPADRYN